MHLRLRCGLWKLWIRKQCRPRPRPPRRRHRHRRFKRAPISLKQNPLNPSRKFRSKRPRKLRGPRSPPRLRNHRRKPRWPTRRKPRHHSRSKRNASCGKPRCAGSSGRNAMPSARRKQSRWLERSSVNWWNRENRHGPIMCTNALQGRRSRSSGKSRGSIRSTYRCSAARANSRRSIARIDRAPFTAASGSVFSAEAAWPRVPRLAGRICGSLFARRG
jgi:hypothetical protein